MGSLFFSCRKSRIAKLNDQEQAIFDCKVTRDKIKQYIKRLEKNEASRKVKAKEMLKEKNKDRARLYLSQSKMYREQINAANGQLNMIEEQIVQIETTNQQKEALSVLQQGNKILKQLNEEVNIDKWERLADDMNEIKQQQEEIGNFLKNRNIDEQDYEEEVDKEIEKLLKLESIEVESSLPETKETKTDHIPPESNKEEVKEDEDKEKILIES